MTAIRSRLQDLNFRRLISPALALGICALLLLAFQHISRSINFCSVSHQLAAMGPLRWFAALAATGFSYLALVGRDAVGLRYVGTPVAKPLLWVGATKGSALGNAAGFGALTGGAVRCRVYGAGGVFSRPTVIGVR